MYVSLGRLVNRISIVLLFLVCAVVLEPVLPRYIYIYIYICSLNYSRLAKVQSYCKARRRGSNTAVFCIWKLPLDGRKEEINLLLDDRNWGETHSTTLQVEDWIVKWVWSVKSRKLLSYLTPWVGTATFHEYYSHPSKLYLHRWPLHRYRLPTPTTIGPTCVARLVPRLYEVFPAEK